MKYQGKSMMSLNEMAKLAIDYEGDGYVTGYPIVSGNDAYILNGVIEANEEYIVINQWVPVFPESLKPVSPSLSDDQQVVLEWLKEKMTLTDIEPIELIWRLKVNSTKSGYRDMPVYKSYRRLTPAQQFQVLAAFASYGLECEE